MEIVAEYQSKINLDMYAQMLYSAGTEYGNCLLVVENNGIGISILEKLITLGYPNLILFNQINTRICRICTR